MAGWKEFAFEWRKRDTTYPSATADHVAIYCDSANTLHTIDSNGLPANHRIGHIEITSGATSWRGGVTNEAWGESALTSNTSGQYNTAVGYWSMYSNQIGSENVAVGFFTLYNNITGTNNVAMGRSALGSNTSGSYNVAVGSDAALSIETGSHNIAIGALSLYQNDEGNFNVAIGSGALTNNISGSNNICIGYNAGYNEQGSHRLYIDNNTTTVGTSADALIYGEFDNKYLRLGGDVDVAGDLTSNGNSAITRVPVPPTDTSPGVPNTIAIDTTHLYVCIGVDSWKRVSLSTF